jgi:hypothetical protein
MIYCGSDNHSGANAIGIATPAEAAALRNALSPSDCDQALPDIAKRVINDPNAPDWIEVMKARVVWAPWTLRFDSTDVAAATRQGAHAPSLKGLGTLASYPTSNLVILPPPGDGRRFDVAIKFPGKVIVAALFATGATTNPLVALTAEASALQQGWDVPKPSNFLADTQYSFVNDLLKTYTPLYEVPIPIEGVTQKMAAKNVQVAGSDNSMTVTGQLAMGDVAYRCAVHSAGPDLVVRQIELNPIPKDCTSNDLMERLQCQGERLATSGSSQSVANALTNYYQGTPFHYSTEEHPLQFELGDRRFIAKFEALKSSATSATIREAGRGWIEATDR